jgi:hypothetical protein
MGRSLRAAGEAARTLRWLGLCGHAGRLGLTRCRSLGCTAFASQLPVATILQQRWRPIGRGLAASHLRITLLCMCGSIGKLGPRRCVQNGRDDVGCKPHPNWRARGNLSEAVSRSRRDDAAEVRSLAGERTAYPADAGCYATVRIGPFDCFALSRPRPARRFRLLARSLQASEMSSTAGGTQFI